MLKNLFATLCCVLLIVNYSFGQSPDAFNYQAVIRDPAGNVLSGQNVSLRASIVENTMNGQVQYQEIHQINTNEAGVLNLQIGNGSVTAGSFAGINWGENNYFLKIEIDAQGGSNYTEIGTTQLLSVPYAIQASTANRADTANFANLADFANGTSVAETASFAETAQQASFANNAINAQQANFAQNALSAQTAAFAEEATFAETAGNQFWKQEKKLVYYDEGTVELLAPGLEPITSTAAQLYVVGKDQNTNDLPFILAGDFSRQQFGVDGLGRLMRLTQSTSGNNFTGNSFDIGIDNNQSLFIQPVSQSGITYNPSFSIGSAGFVGISNAQPLTRLHISDGDVYIDDTEAGIIMKDPDNGCWRIQINSNGQLVPTKLANCPGAP